jgi:hypothetical protein
MKKKDNQEGEEKERRRGMKKYNRCPTRGRIIQDAPHIHINVASPEFRGCRATWVL